MTKKQLPPMSKGAYPQRSPTSKTKHGNKSGATKNRSAKPMLSDKKVYKFMNRNYS